MIGKYLDQYLITARLGNGSLGETFEAKYDKVVLKLINPQLMANPEFAAGLRALVEETSRVHNDGLLSYTHEVSNGRHYLKMAYLEDGSLYAYLQKLRLTEKWIEPLTAVSLVYHILTRLRDETVRSAGLSIHGGLHPRNILLTFRSGETDLARAGVVISDFRQAELVRQCTAGDDHPFRGMAPYTPGELWAEDGQVMPADECADLYALGHLLYYFLHQKHVHPQDVAAEFEQLATKTYTDNRISDSEKVIDFATHIALTAVRIYTHSPPDKTNIWSRWQYALEQFLLGKFEIRSDQETEAPGVDPIWRGRFRPPCLWPEQMLPLLYLPRLVTSPTTADEPQPQTSDDDWERPLDAAAFIEITRHPEETASRRFAVRPGQGLITVGSAPERDITLIDDSQVLPHHLDVRRQGKQWQISLQANHVKLDGESLLADKMTPWQRNQPLIIGSYTLRLREVDAGTDSNFDIGVELLPSVVEIPPGFKKRIGISIRNKGIDRGYFKVRLEKWGHDNGQKLADWLTLPQDGVVLKQGEQFDLPLYVHPPLGEPSQTHHYAVVIQRVTSNVEEQVYFQQKGTIRVVATADFHTSLMAEEGKNDGRFHLLIQNSSNQRMAYQIRSRDPLQALRFAPVDTAVEAADNAQPEPAQRTAPAAHRPSTNPTPFPFATRLRRLVNQTEVGREAAAAASTVRQQKGQVQRFRRAAGTIQPKSNLSFPSIGWRRLRFSETYTPEKVEVAPGQQAILSFVVRSRQRPLRWRPARELPFELVITPQRNEGKTESSTETAVLQATSRLSRASWVLLSGLLLLLCLLASGLAAFQANNTITDFRAGQATAVAVAPDDPDGDGLSTWEEITIYDTDPYNSDTDGDGIKDGVEVSLIHLGVCPTKIDCDDDGVPDAVEIRFMTPTPTPLAGANYPTAAPLPTATPLPTIAPTAVPSPTPPPQKLEIPFTDNGERIQIGDTQNNEQLTHTLYFDTSSLPPNAAIESVHLILVMDNAAEFPELQQKLGNVYVTVGTMPPEQQLAGLQQTSPADLENQAIMSPAPGDSHLLFTELPADVFKVENPLVIRLFFELGSNGDGASDKLSIWSPQLPGLEYPPTLIITYWEMALTNE